jgi:RNA polymerase-binding protein DksA
MNPAPVAKGPTINKTISKETVNKETVNKETDNKAPLSNTPANKPAAKAEAPAAPAGPKPKMLKPELKFFENLLNEKKETLLQELGYLEDNTMRLSSKEGAGDLSSHAYHLADHATETQDREQAFHMASREGKFLYYIEEALDRVRNGTFGICKKCSKLIPKPRLEAVPTAKMCIDCKTAQERASEAVSAG